MNTIFEGVGVALATPFSKGEIDYVSLTNHIEKLIKEKVDAIIILATTGEGSTISINEKKQMIKFCVNLIDHRTKLIVGTGSNNFECCHTLTKLAKHLGADACLVVSPYYNKTTQEGIVKFYAGLNDIDIPIIMYNVPARTGLEIKLETVAKIIKTNPQIVGIKESSTDIERIEKLIKICKNKIAVYSGEDQLNHLFYFLGANGTISVCANVEAKKVKKVFEYAKQNNFIKCKQSQDKIQTLNHNLFCETNPIPVKYLLKKRKIFSSDEVRLPLIPLSKKNRSLFK